MKTLGSYAHSEVHQNAMHQASWWLHNSESDGSNNEVPESGNEVERRNASASFLRVHKEPKAASTPVTRRDRRLERRDVPVERREVPHRRVIP